jgi:hypothetical protein
VKLWDLSAGVQLSTSRYQPAAVRTLALDDRLLVASASKVPSFFCCIQLSETVCGVSARVSLPFLMPGRAARQLLFLIGSNFAEYIQICSCLQSPHGPRPMGMSASIAGAIEVSCKHAKDAAGSMHGRFLLITAHTMQRVWAGHDMCVHACAQKGSLRVWAAGAGGRFDLDASRELTGHTGPVTTVALSDQCALFHSPSSPPKPLREVLH